jgi:hypothetical protein
MTRNLALYPQLVSDGIAAADRCGGAVDHVTARRMSILLISQSQDRDFTRGLIRFARDGAVTHDLKNQLRRYARTPGHPHQPQAARLLQYTAARGTDLGPIGTDFAGLCDQVDRADELLAELHARSRRGRAHPEPPSVAASDPQFIAMARRDPATRTVSLILDDTTANMAIHAIAVSATDREAHTREIQQHAETLPENSYGRRNRQAIATRETRITTRLRAVEHAYRSALDQEPALPLKPAELTAPLGITADRELEME